MRNKEYNEWDYNGIRVERLAIGMDACLAMVFNLGLTIKKKNVAGECVVLVKSKDKILFQNAYSHKYQFLNDAELFVDLHFALQILHDAKWKHFRVDGHEGMKKEVRWRIASALNENLP